MTTPYMQTFGFLLAMWPGHDNLTISDGTYIVEWAQLWAKQFEARELYGLPGQAP